MMRSRLGLLSICTMVLGVMVFSPGVAQAESLAKWLILNSKGTAIDAGSLKSSVETALWNFQGTLLTVILGAKVEVSCMLMTLIGVSLEGSGSLTNGGKAQFTGCSVRIEGELVPECEPHSAGASAGTIQTNALKGLLVLVSGAASRVRIEPKEGTTLATMLMGGECPIGEKIPVSGKLFIKDFKLSVHSLLHVIAEDSENSSLLALGSKAALDGNADAYLAGAHSGLSWGGQAA